MSILQTNDVHYTYKSKYQAVHAVQGISYAFEEGRLYAIIGKSGCGKTTFLSLLAGLDLPSEGTVAFNGTFTSHLNRDQYRREHVALICQSFNLFPLLTVLENVIYPMELRGIKGKTAKGIAVKKLDAVGLGESYHKRLPAMLSGGEQQRVAIARALASKPAIILADEPTGNLDSKTSDEVIELLKVTSQKFHQTIVMITHNPEIAAQADRTIHIEDGRIAE